MLPISLLKEGVKDKSPSLKKFSQDWARVKEGAEGSDLVERTLSLGNSGSDALSLYSASTSPEPITPLAELAACSRPQQFAVDMVVTLVNIVKVPGCHFGVSGSFLVVHICCAHSGSVSAILCCSSYNSTLTANRSSSVRDGGGVMSSRG